MSTTLKFLTYLGCYLLSWTIAYILTFILRGEAMDFRFVIDYFFLAWTFQGYELPTFIWFLSLLIFAVLYLAVVPYIRQRLSSMAK